MTKFAAFDIDGTLFRWQLFYSLVFELKRREVFTPEQATKLDDAFKRWQGKEISWRDFSHTAVGSLIDNLAEIDPEIFTTACHAVVENEGHKVHAYTLNLIKRLKEEGYFLIAITGSMQDIAEPFAAKYGFDLCIGEEYERKDGKFTGVISAVYNRKDEILHDILAAHPNLELTDSYAVGDTHWDGRLLQRVEHPIAFNPDEGLLAEAIEHGWRVVIERKNIAYTLDKGQDGSFILAKTDVL